MGLFIKSQVLKVLFPFSDLSDAKKRPGLVIATIDGDDTILCQITSQNDEQDPYAIPLISADFEEGNLRQSSYIRPNKLFTADPSIISGVIGYITQRKMDEVDTAIIRILQSK